MTFQDPRFVLFFIFVFCLYWILGRKGQNVFLLTASFFFYSLIDYRFAIILFIQSAVCYFSALHIEKEIRWARTVFILTLLFNVIVLLYFKYFNFFIDNFNHLLGFFHIEPSSVALKILLPIGISFYTFQNISYIVDVRRGESVASKSLTDYCLYINFFPKLLAGPIERASNFLTQIEKKRTPELDSWISGLTLFLWGYFQKAVVADNIANISNKVFLLKETSIFILCAGAFAYTIQIFADFAGYTDMARGLGRLLGFDLSKNFNNPYFARNPADFWRRWHMSFSLWIRDYIYIPLGGSRVATKRMILNLFIAFFFTGLWHGASFNFIIWGLYYWLLYILYMLWKRVCPGSIYHFRFNFVISTIVMFIFTNIGWVIFRETDLTYLYKHLTYSLFDWNLDHLPMGIYLVLYVSLLSFPLMLFSAYTFTTNTYFQTTVINTNSKKFILCMILFVSILFFKSANNSQFIYFNF